LQLKPRSRRFFNICGASAGGHDAWRGAASSTRNVLSHDHFSRWEWDACSTD
jgi:hypothetical protein